MKNMVIRFGKSITVQSIFSIVMSESQEMCFDKILLKRYKIQDAKHSKYCAHPINKKSIYIENYHLYKDLRVNS